MSVSTLLITASQVTSTQEPEEGSKAIRVMPGFFTACRRFPQLTHRRLSVTGLKDSCLILLKSCRLLSKRSGRTGGRLVQKSQILWVRWFGTISGEVARAGAPVQDPFAVRPPQVSGFLPA